MAASSKIADLFIELSIKGGAKVELLSLKDKVAAMDRSLANGGKLYQAQTRGKLDQLGKVADRETQLAQMDVKTYQSSRYMETAKKQAAADRAKSNAAEAKHQTDMIAKYGRVGAMLRRMKGGGGGIGGGVGNAISGLASAPNLIGAGAFGLSVGHAVSMASPDAVNTLMRSFDVLSAKLGSHLLPAVDALSGLLQWLADHVPRPARNQVGPQSTGKTDVDYIIERSRLEAENAGTWAGPLTTALNRIIGVRGNEHLMSRDVTTMTAQQRGAESEALRRAATQSAQFLSIEQAWRDIQQKAASQGPLDTDLMQIQIDYLRRIWENTQPAGQTPAQNATNINQPAPGATGP